MTREQFAMLLDRFGSDLRRWPDEVRRDAAELVAEDAAAAVLYDRARRLDGLLAEAVAPRAIEAATVGRIVAGVTIEETGTILRPTGRLVALASAAMIALFVAGFAAGLSVMPDGGDHSIAALLFGGPDESGDLI